MYNEFINVEMKIMKTTTIDAITSQDTELKTWRGECLPQNAELYVGDYLVNEDKTKALQLESTGDLCIYAITATTYHQSNKDNWQLSWCLGAVNHEVSYLTVNAKRGTIELVTVRGNTYWQSGNIPFEEDNYFLTMQNDGNLVLYAGSYDSPQWACGGGGPSNFLYDGIPYRSVSYPCDVEITRNNDHCVSIASNMTTYESNKDGGNDSGSMSSNAVAVIIIVCVIVAVLIVFVLTIRVCCLFICAQKTPAPNAGPSPTVALPDSIELDMVSGECTPTVAIADVTLPQSYQDQNTIPIAVAVVKSHRSRSTASTNSLTGSISPPESNGNASASCSAASVATQDMPVASIYNV